MSALTDRITEVLRTKPVDLGPLLGEGHVPDGWAALAAERIAAALPPMLSPSLMEQLQPEGSDLFIQKANSDNLDWTWRVRYTNGTTGQSDTRTGASLAELLSGWTAVEETQ